MASGDVQAACHVDCSLGGAAACPPSYGCTVQSFDGGQVQLCVPDGGVCLNSEAGFCDRVASPQACDRVNAGGSCSGDRTCQADGQFSTCNAATPTCMTSCSASVPSGCVENPCAGVATTPQNCGFCGPGSDCPGLAYNGSNDNVTCSGGTSCTFSCIGENYDVNANETDGCEVVDSPQGNHLSSAAISVGNLDSCDGSSTFGPSGLFPSDFQVHENPAVPGFEPSSGSAPDWFSVIANGGGTFCVNDAQLTLQVNGSLFPTCYELTYYRPPYTNPPPTCDSNSSGTCSCVADANGTCQTNPGDNTNYNSGDTLYWVVTKVCDISSTEVVTYSVSGHL